MMSTVVTMQKNYVDEGILRIKNLKNIWRPPAYPSELHDSLLALLYK